MEEKLYNTEQLKRIVSDDKEIPLYIQEFVNQTLDRDLGRLQRSYASKEVDMTKKMAYKLRFSLSMYGVHSIQRDLTKIEKLLSDKDSIESIGPLLKRIKNHLRDVKRQMVQDYKMVITLFG
jgi:hypothetical protein